MRSPVIWRLAYIHFLSFLNVGRCSAAVKYSFLCYISFQRQQVIGRKLPVISLRLGIFPDVVQLMESILLSSNRPAAALFFTTTKGSIVLSCLHWSMRTIISFMLMLARMGDQMTLVFTGICLWVLGAWEPCHIGWQCLSIKDLFNETVQIQKRQWSFRSYLPLLIVPSQAYFRECIWYSRLALPHVLQTDRDEIEYCWRYYTRCMLPTQLVASYIS